MKIEELGLEELKNLYETKIEGDFPPSELRPFSSMEYLLKQGAYRCYACREGGETAAYGLFAVNSDAALLDYLAVDPSRRGQGIGTRFLGALRELSEGFGSPWILIEAESVESAQSPEELEERERRIRFYRRCGCRVTGVCSLLFGVEYRILALPLSGDADPSDREVMAGLESLYRLIVPPVVAESGETFEEVCRCFFRPEPRDFARELGRAVTCLQRGRRKFLDERLRDYGLSGAMYPVLLHVSRHPGASQDSIANHMYIDKCNVARRTKKLEELGYIRRETDRADRRQNNLYLTEQGTELIPVIREYLAQWGETAAASLSERERADLISLLSKMTGQNRC